MTTETKIFAGVGLVTLLVIVGGAFLITKKDEKPGRPLMGQEITIESRTHVPESTKINYNSNPPAAGEHYGITAHGGIYDKAPADGNLVHSLEHGAVILWYKADLPQADIKKLQDIYYNSPGIKKIMTPRENLDVPVALSSWGRVLKLTTIDEKQIKDFFEVNKDRGPETAPI